MFLCYHMNLLPHFIQITWTWYYSFIWILSRRSIISAKTSAVPPSVSRCTGFIISLWSLHRHAHTGTVCVTGQGVKQWWNSRTCGSVPSQNDTSSDIYPKQEGHTKTFSGCRTLSESGSHDRSHQISWKQPFYLLKCDWWRTWDSWELVCKNYLYCSFFNSDFVFAFRSCTDSRGEHYNGNDINWRLSL